MGTESKDEYELLEEELEEKGRKIAREINVNKATAPQGSKFGICATCGFLEFAETKFHTLFARCAYFLRMLHTGNPFIICTQYSPWDEPDLLMMLKMATLINTDGSSKTIAPFSNQKK
jgi:hypothetical protein